MQNFIFKKLVSNITQDVLNDEKWKGVKINDFNMYAKEHNKKIHFKVQLNTEKESVKRYINTQGNMLGFKKDSSPITVEEELKNWKKIDHNLIYKSFTKAMKHSAISEKSGFPETSLLIECSLKGSDKSSKTILAPTLELAKKAVANHEKFKIIDWGYDVKKHQGYKQRWANLWKKEVKLSKVLEKEGKCL